MRALYHHLLSGGSSLLNMGLMINFWETFFWVNWRMVWGSFGLFIEDSNCLIFNHFSGLKI
jgi:hypothetical protein